MNTAPRSQGKSVDDDSFRQKIIDDLAVALPGEIRFVVDVIVFTNYDVMVQVDRGVYLVSFSLFAGLSDATYQKALHYAIDYVLDHRRRAYVEVTSDRVSATTAVPSQTEFTRFQLVACGATADVYRSFQLSTQREVAVKVFRDRSEATLTAAARETAALVAVRHEMIPTVIGYYRLESNNTEPPYLVMEWRNGRSLSNPQCLQQFLNLTYSERLHHFVLLCQAFHALHSAGIVHGDLHGGNLLYDPAANRLTIVDFGKLVEPATENAEFGLTDVRALGKLFASVIGVPPIPFYPELIGGVSSVNEMLALLSSLPLLRISKHRMIERQQLPIFSDERYTRMAEWIHIFRQQFDIQARITFQYDRSSKIPVRTEFDQSSTRAVIICGGVFDLVDEFAVVIRELLRIYLRDWTFTQHERLSGTDPKRDYTEMDRGDGSRELQAGRGLSARSLLTGLADTFTKHSESQSPVSERMEKLGDPEVFVAMSSYAQAMISSVAVDWVRSAAVKGTFGYLTAKQIAALDSLVEVYGSFADGSAFRRLPQFTDHLKRKLTAAEVQLLKELEERCVDACEWPTASFALLVEVLSLLLSNAKAHAIFTPAGADSHHLSVHPVGQYTLMSDSTPLLLRYTGTDGSQRSSLIPNQDSIDLAAVIAFEKAARSPRADSFYQGRFSVHGRVHVGNVLGINDDFGVLMDNQWDKMAQIVIQQVLQQPKGADLLKVRLRTLFETYTRDLRIARYNGRIGIVTGASADNAVVMRSLGLVSLMNFDNAPASAIIDRWVGDELGGVLDRLLRVTDD